MYEMTYYELLAALQNLPEDARNRELMIEVTIRTKRVFPWIVNEVMFYNVRTPSYEYAQEVLQGAMKAEADYQGFWNLDAYKRADRD